MAETASASSALSDGASKPTPHAPLVPATRAPVARPPAKDSVSDNFRPPLRPPSRTVSPADTSPRTSRVRNPQSATASNASVTGPPHSPLTPTVGPAKAAEATATDAVSATESAATQRSWVRPATRRAQAAAGQQPRAKPPPSPAALPPPTPAVVPASNRDSDVPGHDTDSVQFVVAQSATPNNAASQGGDSISFRVEPSVPQSDRVPTSPQIQPSHGGDSISFRVEPSIPQSDRVPTSPQIQPSQGGDSISFRVEPSVPQEKRMASSHSQGSIAFQTEPSLTQPQRIGSASTTDSIAFRMEPSNTRRSSDDIDMQHIDSMPPTEMRSATLGHVVSAPNPDDSPAHDAKENSASAVAESIDFHVAPGTPSAGTPAPTPLHLSLEQPEGDAPPPPPPPPAAKKTAKVARAGRPVAPRARAPPEPTKARQPAERNRTDLMAARPWRTASPKTPKTPSPATPAAPLATGQQESPMSPAKLASTEPGSATIYSMPPANKDRPWRNASASPKKGRQSSPWAKKKTAKEVAEEEHAKPEKTRAELMRERPWRSPSASPSKGRQPSPWAKKKTAKDDAEEEHAKPEKTRAELMGERPWRTSASPPKVRTTSHNRRGRPQRPRSPVAATSGGVHGSGRAGGPHALALYGAPLMISADEVGSMSEGQWRTPMDSPRPQSIASMPTPMARSTAALMTPLVPKVTTPPPVLLRSPWAILSEEVNEWTEMANQTANLRRLLMKMREQERQVAVMAQHIRNHEMVLQGVDKELYGLRDDHVRRRGLDINGAALRPSRIDSQLPSARSTHSLGAASSSSRAISGANGALSPTSGDEADAADFSVRLYPHSARKPSPYIAMASARRRQVSVLSDDELSDTDIAHYADELDTWRDERKQLKQQKARLVQQNRDLKYHIRRGTHIKDIAAVGPTSARAPIQRSRQKTSSAVDEFGYDILAKLRLEASAAQCGLQESREKFSNAESGADARRRAVRAQFESTRDKRDLRKREFVLAANALIDNINRARSLVVIENERSPQKSPAPGHEDDDRDGWRTPRGIYDTAPELSNAERRKDLSHLLYTRVAEAEEVLHKARLHQREVDSTPRGRRRSRSIPRSIGAQAY